ncbi:PREDICTED: signal recognition particle subunit SRP68-like [Priapulus caudatus]|uniref:Signal recognition particle subunit SRP68 n=1 Tax=Priapulus caudatus TaxID=37621 RepID=A0ABM1EXX9_PRICU|nr:PREDICTED: signal recognition particle subunit SRP68-like [Priapulus caudatus]
MAAKGELAAMEKKENTENEEPKKEQFTLEILVVVRDAQQQHGLRHGDYHRYRSYCTRRLRRIRKSLHLCMTSGKRRYQSKKVDEANLKDVRFLYVPLISAERAWSYAMQLKTESNTEPRKRFHMIERLRRATQHADALLRISNHEKCDARTKLEGQAYHAAMQATLSFELQKWEEAMELFQKARTIYEKLGSMLTEDLRQLYQQRVEELLPNIRYCAYNIGDESALSDLMQMRLASGKAGGEDLLSSTIDVLIAQTREKQSSTLSEVTWRGRCVPVTQEKVRMFLLNLRHVDENLREGATEPAEGASEQTDDLDSKVSVYESLLMDCKDALQELREEIRADPKSHDQKGGKQTVIQFLHTYLMYIRLSKTSERYLLLVDSLKASLTAGGATDGKKVAKPQDLIRLYDVIIQNLSEIPLLPGLEDDASLSQEINTKVLSYKAFRCFYIAQSYAALKKWKEAMALYERTLTHTAQALDGYKTMNTTDNQQQQQSISELDELTQLVESKRYSVQANSILDSVDTTTDTLSRLSVKEQTLPLANRLERYYEDPALTKQKANLVSFPPDFQAIPAKPLFFDLALNQVEFPSLEDRIEQKKAAGGLSGMVKGWLWGGKR